MMPQEHYFQHQNHCEDEQYTDTQEIPTQDIIYPQQNHNDLHNGSSFSSSFEAEPCVDESANSDMDNDIPT